MKQIATDTNRAPSEALTLYDHLAELRIRIMWIFIALVITSIVAFTFATELFSFLTAPLSEAFPKGKFIGTGPAEAFIVKLKTALFAGILLAAPIIFWQLWLFIAPGLLDNEKKTAIPFVIFCSVFFLIGVSFCFKIVLPFAFQFFYQQYDSIGVSPDIRIVEYLSFVTRLLLVFGVVFELPVLSYFLAKLNLISASWLISKSRYAIVLIFVLSAILTPPDVTTMFLLAFPLIGLYGICILIAHFVAPKPTGTH